MTGICLWRISLDMDTLHHDIKPPGERLADHLKAHSVSQAQFAESIGINQASLSKICRGLFRPSLPTAVAISRETGGAIPTDAWVAADERGAA